MQTTAQVTCPFPLIRITSKSRTSSPFSPTNSVQCNKQQNFVARRQREGAGRSAPFYLLPAKQGVLLDKLETHDPPTILTSNEIAFSVALSPSSRAVMSALFWECEMRAEGADHSVHKLHLKSLGLTTGTGLGQQGLLGDWF